MNTLNLLTCVQQFPEQYKDAQGQTHFRTGDRKSQLEIDIISLQLMLSLVLESLPPLSVETILQQFRALLEKQRLMIQE